MSRTLSVAQEKMGNVQPRVQANTNFISARVD